MPSILSRLSPTTIAILGVVAFVQVVLQIWCLIDLSRRDSVYGGRKWLWAVIIIAGNLLGAIIYLGMGRVVYQPASGDDERAGSEKATRRAVDNLYGDRK